MKKITYKLNEHDTESQTLYIDLPDCFDCAWLSTTCGNPTTDEDADDDAGELFNEQITEIIHSSEPEECTPEDYDYIMKWAEFWGILEYEAKEEAKK